MRIGAEGVGRNKENNQQNSFFSVRKSGRHKLQGAVIVDQTQAGTDTQLSEEKEQWRHQLQISSNSRYYRISSMQNTSKLQYARMQSQKWSIN